MQFKVCGVSHGRTTDLQGKGQSITIELQDDSGLQAQKEIDALGERINIQAATIADQRACIEKLTEALDPEIERRLVAMKRQLDCTTRSETAACERNMTKDSEIHNLRRILERIRVDLDH